MRDLLFRPRPTMTSLHELNAWLADLCAAYAKCSRHLELRARTISAVFEEEHGHFTASA